MIEHPAVRKINFTGSTAVGRKIARSCGQNLKPCLMELGGKNSSIVCADADLDIAVQGVLAGAFLNVCSPRFSNIELCYAGCDECAGCAGCALTTSPSPAKSAWQQIAS